MLKSVNGCAHEWFISLTESEDEAQLDVRLIDSLQAILQTQKIAVFVRENALKEQNITLITDNLTEQDFTPENIDSLYLKLQDNKIHTCLCSQLRISYIPICHCESVIGFVVAVHTKEEILDTNQFGTAVNVLHIYANQRHVLFKNRLDPLTELLNRQTFESKLMEVIAGHDHREKIGEHCAWYLGMLDIDNFKQVNDQFGHVIGDEVLILIARLIKTNFRSQDYIFRYGGEEFSVLFKCAAEDTAVLILERLRGMIAQHIFPQVGTITISIGFTELESGRILSTLVQQADVALYDSKRSGRNKVTNFKQIEGQHHLEYGVEHEHELFK
ncbi:GGDEF domain-containing protein [Moritella sp.]|uniref:GGDEF domain-containing protein n=1 Tax=Moritella sp. TaxID=78556 RepID=UPI001DC85BED|nr:GGDEF domain-containing protein [Moritella sp.]MCJ8351553.1 GGDEF domain-containing protein [Moritella sp.]NQZ38514.1 GGDEF domain-containing protein [Moritella sp.]